MLYHFEHVYSPKLDYHTFTFHETPVILLLSPLYFLYPDIDPALKIYLADISNPEWKAGEKNINYGIGESIIFGLEHFLMENKDCAFGYYPSIKGNKDAARVFLFNKWFQKCQNPDDFFTLKNQITITETEQLTIQLFAHNQYPNQVALITTFNNISKAISEK